MTCGPTALKNGINVIKVPHGKAVGVRDSVLSNKFDPEDQECRLSTFLQAQICFERESCLNGWYVLCDKLYLKIISGFTGSRMCRTI